jgi:hypothetical protein
MYNRKRNNRVVVTLDDAEYRYLRQRTEKTGLNMAAYFRHLLKTLVPRDLPPPDYHALIKEFHAIGNNINQMAHIANATGFIDAEKLDEIRNTLNEAILNLMREVTEQERR